MAGAKESRYVSMLVEMRVVANAAGACANRALCFYFIFACPSRLQDMLQRAAPRLLALGTVLAQAEQKVDARSLRLRDAALF